ncbi:penicillin-binding protein, partial [Salmonella sp. gx-f8]|nr:penicillin-binding protein [Salmonella sp. gx-f8]
EQAIDDALVEHPNSDDLQSAVVVSAAPKLVRATMLSGETIDLAGDGLRFAQAALSANAQPKIKLRPGAIIRVIQDPKTGKWSIT